MNKNVDSRIGILGGTFNPVHAGHIRHAIEVGEAMGFERVLLSPVSVPPHKSGRGILPFALRVRLLRAALRGVPLLEVSTLEGELEGPSYTWLVLREWAARNKGAGKPWFLLGVEDFAMLDTWFHGGDLPRAANLLAVPRAGSDLALFREAAARFWPGDHVWESGEDGRHSAHMADGGLLTYLPVPRLDISSSLLRARWLAGRDISALTPGPVLDILEEHRAETERIWQEGL